MLGGNKKLAAGFAGGMSVATDSGLTRCPVLDKQLRTRRWSELRVAVALAPWYRGTVNAGVFAGMRMSRVGAWVSMCSPGRHGEARMARLSAHLPLRPTRLAVSCLSTLR